MSDANWLQIAREQQLKLVMGPVAILWDIENCPVPVEANVEDVAANLRMALRVHPAIRGSVTMFSAYGDFNYFPRKVREGCQRTGVNLIDVPNGKKDASDKAILVDMFLFALDNPPPCTIFLISGDVDFASALHKLGQRGYTIVLAIPSGVGVASTLCSAGRYVWDWPSVARGEGLVPAKAFHSCEGNDIIGYVKQGSGCFGSDDSDQSKDEFVLAEASQRSLFKSKGYPSLQSNDFVLNSAGPDQNRNFNPAVVKGAKILQSTADPTIMVNALDPSTRVLPANLIVPQNWQSTHARCFENSPVINKVTEGVQCEELHDDVEPTSPGAVSETSWVQPGDLEGLRRQLVKLLSLHGGRLLLLRLPAEYSRTFGRPLYLAEYKSPKLAHLLEKMCDTFLVKGKGTTRTLHLTNTGMHIAMKYKNVWGTCILKNDTTGNSSKVGAPLKKSAQNGCSHPGSACSQPKVLESQRISGSSPDSDSSSADEKAVDREEREGVTDCDIQSNYLVVEQQELSAGLEAFKNELQELLVSHACKILVNSFLALYQLRYARHLEYRALGFQTLESLLDKVQDVAVLEEDEGSGKRFLVAKCAAPTRMLREQKNMMTNPSASPETVLQGQSSGT